MSNYLRQQAETLVQDIWWMMTKYEREEITGRYEWMTLPFSKEEKTDLDLYVGYKTGLWF